MAVLAGLALALNCVAFPCLLFLFVWTAEKQGPPRDPTVTTRQAELLVSAYVAGANGCFVAVPTLAIYPLMLFCALRMRKGRDWGLALTAAILALLPVSLSCLISLPVGIWALVVLFDPDVKARFR